MNPDCWVDEEEREGEKNRGRRIGGKEKEKEGVRVREAESEIQRERQRESKGTDGPGRGKRYNPISCTINRPSGHPTAQLQHISAGRTKDGFTRPQQTCLSVKILEPEPPSLKSWIRFDVL